MTEILSTYGGVGTIQPRYKDLMDIFRISAPINNMKLIHEAKPLEVAFGPLYTVFVHSFDGGLKIIKPPNNSLDNMTVLMLKKEVLEIFCNSGTINDMKLIHEGKPLNDDSALLSRYGIKPRFVVQMVMKVNGG